MKKYMPTRNALNILRVITLLICLVISAVAWIYLSDYPIIMWVTIVLFWILLILFQLFLPIYFSKTCYCFSSGEISKKIGFFIETQQLMRISSVQYYTEIVTPFSKYTGFNFIKLNALGGFIIMFFLSKSDADDIAAALSAAINTNLQQKCR